MRGPGWEQVVRALGARPYAPVDVSAPRAAVALLLRDGESGIELLLIRRAEHERDPWSGQVGFPGGRAEREDASLEATAVRETLEETGIDLHRHTRLLGRLDDLRALARGRPVDLVIAPFVFRLLRPVDGAPSHEVVSLHWLPLATLLDPASRASYEYHRDDLVVQLPSLRVGGLVIWGLTHRMFANFASLLESAPGAASP
jgi:8-oxo-dGTP pyrophosphatase MutT (NUDIX family)